MHACMIVKSLVHHAVGNNELAYKLAYTQSSVRVHGMHVWVYMLLPMYIAIHLYAPMFNNLLNIISYTNN